MDIKTLKKYDRSRLDGVLIRQINCLDDGQTVQIISENGNMLESWVEECQEFSADYIICELQDLPNIEVSKY